MISYLTLSDIPRREKEKVMLLLAAADDKAWRTVQDAQHRLCVEWRVSSRHPALSFLSLGHLQSMHKGSSSSSQDINAARNCQEMGSSPGMRSASRARGRPSVQRESLHCTGSGAADCSPLTIDWNNDSSSAMEPISSPSVSYSFANILSPGANPQQRRRASAVMGTSVKTPRSNSQGSLGGTSFLNTRSTFLHRHATPKRSISAPRAVLLEHHGLLGSSGRRKGASTAVSGPNESNSRSTAPMRSAQWVSRLVEDIMGYVAKMNTIDHHQVTSVATLAVSVLKARYGALQWNRVLKELAQGLHRYRSVSSLCRVFREFFVDESSCALEDFFTFSRLHRAVVKHGTVETQKVSLPLEEADNNAPRPLFQDTIVLRRYVELRLLTSVLNDMLAAVTIADQKGIGTVPFVRRRKLNPEEVVGVKTVVAYWVEEESSREGSLAFDLGGFVDLHEVLATVVLALSSVRRRNSAKTPNAPRNCRLNINDVELHDNLVASKDQSFKENIQPVSYAERARLIMQMEASEAENLVKSSQKVDFRHTPLAEFMSKPVELSAKDTNGSAMREEPVRIPVTVYHGSDGKRQEAYHHVSDRLNKAAPAKEFPHAFFEETACGDENEFGHSTHLLDAAVSPSLPRLSPRQLPGDPLVIDLDHIPPTSAGIHPSPPLTLSEETAKRPADVHKMDKKMQPLRHLAALAAIDAEMQRRREVLNSTVAFGPATRDTSSDVNFRMQPALPDVPCREDEVGTKGPGPGPTSNKQENGMQEFSWSAEATHLEEELGSSRPPAHASTFSNVISPSLTVQHTPSSILLPSKHRAPERTQERSEENEGPATRSDFEMLTLEEQHLLADLQQALSQQR